MLRLRALPLVRSWVWPLALLALVAGAAPACSKDADAEAQAGARAGGGAAAAASGPLSGSAPARDDPSPATALQRDDLEAMCAAVDHDYVDGTLSDYFAGLETRSPWGAALEKRAADSMTPGRELQKAAAAAGLDGPKLPPSCAKLFDYLDDVE